MVNPAADGYSETLNHRKILRKTQKIRQAPSQNFL